ncbi:type III secretion system outer membrane ring subunit SctC [Sphingomonas xinjiangensis]|uniref:Type 3 secretion system secretin n=1 Tax=Sphingomonas xinjiangensis TaxID=643568 RepID=A0A840YMB0_9SPHN|nr:type III secretion system outer membrane ring subunit SctC [Sphingomonas xinjiangensis]MBB5710906.1 type III secretion protein C [Sphingomonas xinjiangensis]
MIRLSRAVMLLACAALLPQPGAAQEPPLNEKTITFTARAQNVDAAVADLFGQSGLKVKVSSAISGKVNGVWTGSPKKIWSQLSRAFNLVAYYDGAVVRVYSSAEIQSRSFNAANPRGVVRDARKLRIVDDANKVAASSGSVSATGVPAFLDRVAQLAGSASGAPAIIHASTTPSTAAVISPLLGPAALETVSSVPIRSRVLSSATARSPYEVRVFYLRYARADDTIQKSFDRTITIPGVGSILRGMMGDGRPSNTVSTAGNFDIQRQSLPRLGGRGLNAVPPDEDQRSFDQQGTPGLDTVVIQQAAVRDINGPRVEVDPTNNAVLVRDRPESMKVYEDIVRALDVEPRGVEIEATILELDTSRLKELGLDFGFGTGGLGALFGGTAMNPTESFSNGNIGAAYLTGGLDLFVARITALEKTGALHVISRPRLSTLNNIPAVFNNQVQYYVRVAGDRQVDLFPVTAGMVMRVNPSVLFDGGELRTRLSIEILDGSPSGMIVDGIPAVKQSSINTSAVVKQGESLLIGGMTVDQQYDFKSKVPVAGDIPILGQAFRKRKKGAQHMERIFLITPRVVSRSSQVAAMRPSATDPIPIEQIHAAAKGKKRGRK